MLNISFHPYSLLTNIQLTLYWLLFTIPPLYPKFTSLKIQYTAAAIAMETGIVSIQA
jgi:hypothetical protein